MKSFSLKKGLVFCLFALALTGTKVFAQQITKFAVVDTDRIYQSYYKNSTALKNYENKKNEFQKEIDKRTEELQQLQQTKLTYEKAGDSEMSKSIQSEISTKTQSLTDYINAKNIELDKLKNNLKKNDAFYQKLYASIAKIAEKDGYSMVLSLQDTASILWYSNSVDITNDVIRELGLRVR